MFIIYYFLIFLPLSLFLSIKIVPLILIFPSLSRINSFIYMIQPKSTLIKLKLSQKAQINSSTSLQLINNQPKNQTTMEDPSSMVITSMEDTKRLEDEHCLANSWRWLQRPYNEIERWVLLSERERGVGEDRTTRERKWSKGKG